MRIAHVIYSFNTGGSETMLVDIMNEQIKENEVMLIVVNRSYREQLLSTIDQRVQVLCINRPMGSRNPWYFVRLNYVLIRLNPDVIHLHSSTLSSLIFGLKHKLFYTCHAMHLQFIPQHFKKVFAISEAVAEDIRTRIGADNVVVVPNGICCEKIRQRSVEEKEPTSTFRIVNVARLEHEKKGQDILIKAVAQLKEKGGENITVDFIGEGASLNFLQNLVQSLGLSQQVKFLGLRDREYIYEHLADYDLMCHPSRYEGFGLTVAEGMAAGLPVLVSASGGPYEIIERGKLGYSFKTGDVEECSKQIMNIMKDYTRVISTTQERILHITQCYSIQRLLSLYCKEYLC